MGNSLHFLLIFAVFANLQISLCIDETPEESFGERYWKTIGRDNYKEDEDEARGKYRIRHCCYIFYTLKYFLLHIFTLSIKY